MKFQSKMSNQRPTFTHKKHVTFIIVVVVIIHLFALFTRADYTFLGYDHARVRWSPPEPSAPRC